MICPQVDLEVRYTVPGLGSVMTQQSCAPSSNFQVMKPVSAPSETFWLKPNSQEVQLFHGLYKQGMIMKLFKERVKKNKCFAEAQEFFQYHVILGLDVCVTETGSGRVHSNLQP